MKKAAIVSARFNPAFVQHAIAYAKALRELGLEVEFFLDPGYAGFPEFDSVAPAVFDFTIEKSETHSYAVFLNASARNVAMARHFKRRGARVIYLYHEPWNLSWDYLRREGIEATAKTILAHRVTVPMLKIADSIFLGSQYGLQLYRAADIRYNQNAHYFPHIYDDEAGAPADRQPERKIYFAYIGNTSRPHGFDQFVATMRELLRRGLDMHFLIASKNPLPSSAASDDLLRDNANRVKLVCGRPLKSAEINRCYAESFCVWNLYRRSTQSGVLPKAFMFGAPVIASNLGSFPEFVRDGWNGKFASTGDIGGIVNALEDMRSRQREYAANCRATFLETFYYKSRLADLERLLR